MNRSCLRVAFLIAMLLSASAQAQRSNAMPAYRPPPPPAPAPRYTPPPTANQNYGSPQRQGGYGSQSATGGYRPGSIAGGASGGNKQGSNAGSNTGGYKPGSIANAPATPRLGGTPTPAAKPKLAANDNQKRPANDNPKLPANDNRASAGINKGALSKAFGQSGSATDSTAQGGARKPGAAAFAAGSAQAAAATSPRAEEHWSDRNKVRVDKFNVKAKGEPLAQKGDKAGGKKGDGSDCPPGTKWNPATKKCDGPGLTPKPPKLTF